MNPGAISRPIARDTMSQPITSAISATMPIARLVHEVRRKAKYSANGVPDNLIASHSTATTAGSPIITDSEITVPLPATVLIEPKSKGGPLATKNPATSRNCPANIAANISAPHSVVPQNFQIFGAGAGNGVAGPAGLSSEPIDGLFISVAGQVRITASNELSSSWPDLFRSSTSFQRKVGKDVDAWLEAAHDETRINRGITSSPPVRACPARRPRL